MNYNSEDTKKYKWLRPIFPLSMEKKIGVLKDKFKNENAVLWWKYSIQCVKKILREKKGIKGQFRLSDSKLNEYKQEFLLLYARIIENCELTIAEKQKYNSILFIFDIRQLKL